MNGPSPRNIKYIIGIIIAAIISISALVFNEPGTWEQFPDVAKPLIETAIVAGSVMVAYAYRVSANEAKAIIKKIQDATDPASIGGETITADEALDIIEDVIIALKKEEE